HRLPHRLDQRQHVAGHRLRPRGGVPPDPAPGPLHRAHEVPGMTDPSSTAPSASGRGSGALPATSPVTRLAPAALFASYGPLLAIGIFAVVMLVWAPGALSAFRLGNLGKYCAWAIAAVGSGLAWGRGGMLVMGQGVFFG